MFDWQSRLNDLSCTPIDSRKQPSILLVEEFENYIGIPLPEDYREFASKHAGMWLDASAPIAEPTPFGGFATIESFYGFLEDGYHDLKSLCDISNGTPVAIPIGEGYFGCQTYIFVSDYGNLIERGSIYFFDSENRSAWDDEMFSRMFPNLDPEIENGYLRIRRENKLPYKPDALQDFYFVANSFISFMESLVPNKD